jgi:hypothetical protein
MTERKASPLGTPILVCEQISFGIEALVRRICPPFGTERTEARTQIGAEIASLIFNGMAPERAVAMLVSAIERVEQQATVR